jgi:hypothetical protein
MWSVIEMVFKMQIQNAPVAESLARMFRNAMETYAQYFYPLFERLVPLLASAYETTTMPCFIWVSGHAVRVFGPHQECHPALTALISQLLGKVHAQIQAGNNDEEMIEEYHYLIISSLKTSSNLLPSALIEQTFMCSIHCLAKATPSTMASLSEYTTQMLESPQANQVIIKHAQQFLTALLKAMTTLFAQDRQVVDDVTTLFIPLIPLLGPQITQLVQTSLTEVSISAETQQKFMTNFTKYLGVNYRAVQTQREGDILRCFRELSVVHLRRNLERR